MRGREIGSKNKSVASAAIKEPYVYAALKILEQARIDFGTKYGADGERCEDCVDNLWEQWLETETYKQRNEDELIVACGIGSYLGG